MPDYEYKEYTMAAYVRVPLSRSIAFLEYAEKNGEHASFIPYFKLHIICMGITAILLTKLRILSACTDDDYMDTELMDFQKLLLENSITEGPWQDVKEELRQIWEKLSKTGLNDVKLVAPIVLPSELSISLEEWQPHIDALQSCPITDAILIINQLVGSVTGIDTAQTGYNKKLAQIWNIDGDEDVYEFRKLIFWFSEKLSLSNPEQTRAQGLASLLEKVPTQVDDLVNNIKNLIKAQPRQYDEYQYI